MLLNDTITLMMSLLKKDLQEAIILLKNKNINYAYNIARLYCDCCGTFCRIGSRRNMKFNNSFIYFVVKEEEIVECKLYQVNKEQIYVVTILGKYKREELDLEDEFDIIIPL